MSTDLRRRDFLRLGTLAALAAAARPLRAGAAPASRAKACILLYMEGGPSQIDTFDPKPGHANGGSFRAIPTSVAGLQFSEHLPRLAARAQRLAVVRTLTAREGNHDRARHLMHCGQAPAFGADHPGLGALVSRSRGASAMPGYVSIAGPGAGAGLLGAAWSPYVVPQAGGPQKFLELPSGVDGDRFERRLVAQAALDARFLETHPVRYALARRELSERAAQMIRSPASQLLALDSESPGTRASYGDGAFGRGCLLARRLVEAGVPFVEVTLKGWDTHEDNFERVRKLSGELDLAMSALLDDLDARGLLDSTLVLWWGDFGRTPKINERGGRDHFPRVSSAVLAGARLNTGLAVGESSADGMEIRSRPVTVPDLFRTVAVRLGLDAEAYNDSPEGRPVPVVDGGTLISELG